MKVRIDLRDLQRAVAKQTRERFLKKKSYKSGKGTVRTPASPKNILDK